MKKRALFLFLWLILLSSSSLVWAGQMRVYFSPNGGCTDAIVEQIANARKEILIQAYSFTSRPISQALVQAKKRGVKITVILDRSNRGPQYSAATFLKNMEIPIFIDDRHAIAHNKIILIDGRVVITGSFNFTMAAEKDNAENLLVLEDLPELTQAYLENFRRHLEHSAAY